jgi:hypothetical protein
MDSVFSDLLRQHKANTDVTSDCKGRIPTARHPRRSGRKIIDDGLGIAIQKACDLLRAMVGMKRAG